MTFRVRVRHNGNRTRMLHLQKGRGQVWGSPPLWWNISQMLSAVVLLKCMNTLNRTLKRRELYNLSCQVLGCGELGVRRRDRRSVGGPSALGPPLSVRCVFLSRRNIVVAWKMNTKTPDRPLIPLKYLRIRSAAYFEIVMQNKASFQRNITEYTHTHTSIPSSHHKASVLILTRLEDRWSYD